MKLPGATLMLAAIAAAAGCGGSGAPPRPPGPGEIVMTEYAFSPRDASAKRGAELTVRNEGQIAHNLTVERPDSTDRLIGTDTMVSGRSAKLDLDVPPGRYTIVCTVPGHEQRGMAGTLRVR